MSIKQNRQNPPIGEKQYFPRLWFHGDTGKEPNVLTWFLKRSWLRDMPGTSLLRHCFAAPNTYRGSIIRFVERTYAGRLRSDVTHTPRRRRYPPDMAQSPSGTSSRPSGDSCVPKYHHPGWWCTRTSTLRVDPLRSKIRAGWYKISWASVKKDVPDRSSFLLIVSSKTMIPYRCREEEALNSIKSLQPTWETRACF